MRPSSQSAAQSPSIPASTTAAVAAGAAPGDDSDPRPPDNGSSPRPLPDDDPVLVYVSPILAAARWVGPIPIRVGAP